MGNEASYDYYSGYGDDGVNRRTWADISQVALRRENQAKDSFATIKKEWESRKDLEPGSKHVIPLLNPSHHLVEKVWVRFHRQVKALKNSNGSACWDLKRREATYEERDTYRITRKSKVFFIDAIYKVPKNTSSLPKKQSKAPVQPVAPTAAAVASAESKKRASIPTTSPSAGASTVSSGSLPKKPRLSNSTNIVVERHPLVTPGTMTKKNVASQRP